jgi:hypothetical protein
MTVPAIRFIFPAIGLVLLAQSALLRPAWAEAETTTIGSWFPSTEPSLGETLADANNLTARRSVPPTGWRRTTRGWERAETWGSTSAVMAGDSLEPHGFRGSFATTGGIRPQTVGQWMAWDQAREPSWANAVLGALKRINPLFFAVFLVGVALVITRISEPKTANPNEPGSACD